MRLKYIIDLTQQLQSLTYKTEFRSYNYNWTMFNPEAKKQRHETVFPEDKNKAFALGEQMASEPW